MAPRRAHLVVEDAPPRAARGVRVVRAAVTHDCDAILQREARREHRRAGAYERAPHERGAPRQADAAHGRGVDRAVQEGAHVGLVMHLGAWRVCMARACARQAHGVRAGRQVAAPAAAAAPGSASRPPPGCPLPSPWRRTRHSVATSGGVGVKVLRARPRSTRRSYRSASCGGWSGGIRGGMQVGLGEGGFLLPRGGEGAGRATRAGAAAGAALWGREGGHLGHWEAVAVGDRVDAEVWVVHDRVAVVAGAGCRRRRRRRCRQARRARCGTLAARLACRAAAHCCRAPGPVQPPHCAVNVAHVLRIACLLEAKRSRSRRRADR